jgi:hypothetical protein
MTLAEIVLVLVDKLIEAEREKSKEQTRKG